MKNQTVNILLVDDREENLIALEAVLSAKNYNLIKAYSGEEALKYVLKEEFAVIIMDVQMPGINGFETAKMIRKRKKTQNVPIIFITALSQTVENILHGYSVGAIDYIIKPFDALILTYKVDGLVAMYLNKKKVEEQAKTIAKYTNELAEAYRALQINEEKLEALVKERTNELSLTNEKLLREINEKEAAMLKLEESEEKYRQLTEESPMAILVKKDHCDTYSFINQTGVQLFKANSKEDVLKQPIKKLIHPGDYERIEKLKEEREKGQFTLEARLVCMNGEVIDAEVKSIPLIYKGEQALHLMIRDITELKRSREFMQQSEKLTVVGELAAGIAHEIRNPLTSLKGFTQLLGDQMDCNHEYMDIMITEIERINTIVGELLLLAKPSKLEFKQINLGDILENIITLMNAQANLYGVKIKLESSQSLSDRYIFGIEDKIKQVFINLVKNAIESMEDGGEVIIQVMEGEKYFEIKFIDGGCGIPREILSKLGQPFFTTKDRGTGLGLMVCYSIIESHHGTMLIDSACGQGTTVSVSLPLFCTETVIY
ncbi:response regulator [Bacillus benzoevorans]|uniref:histidine kinase n=1 Tax=Bacillus benzoevorans TaxID=1456 RepID=A0A7X0HTL7_9BACI|nr:response regulator [Bacillus benzoevorans]MBB6445356.1 PAS domain S-box-containing protein [Bacillus benzoevorans]